MALRREMKEHPINHPERLFSFQDRTRENWLEELTGAGAAAERERESNRDS